MVIPFTRWYPAIAKRRSRRKFDPSHPIPPDVLSDLQKTCLEFRPFPGARTELVIDSPEEVFKGAVGAYGKVKGALAYFAFIGDTHDPHVQETVGYTGEGLILEAVAQGLATCWVAGFFRPKVVSKYVKVSSNERVLAVSPVGFVKGEPTMEEKVMASFGRHSHRKPISRLVTGLLLKEEGKWINVALDAARMAPSAINRQPWKFRIDEHTITVYTGGRMPDFNVSKRLDCGIAMLHLETAALNQGVMGKWELLNPPLVARFIFKE